MEKTVKDLSYVRGLLIAMSKLNQNELQFRTQIRPIMQARNVQHKKSTKKVGWIVLLVVIFVVMTLLLALSYAPPAVRKSVEAYKRDIVDEEFNWVMNHHDDKQPYPGYSGSVSPITFGVAYKQSLPRAGGLVLFWTVIAGAIIFTIQRVNNKAIDRNNKLQTQQYQAVMAQNQQILALNQRVQQQIIEVHKRKELISQEYITSICPWFPKEYCYFEAIDYFIHELQIGTATTLPEAIKNYRQYLFENKVTGKLDQIAENQSTMIRNEEEMIRQQMIGNFIACASWMETKNISNNVRNIARNTSNVELNTRATAWNTYNVAQNTQRK